MSVLQRWQQLHGFSDDVAAQHLGLALGEFRRQRVVGPSRQTALIAVLVSVYRPDLTKIRAALADLARRRRRRKRQVAKLLRVRHTLDKAGSAPASPASQ